MSNQIKFNDNILDEVIPIYLDSVSAKERLENDILRLQGEVEELKTISKNLMDEDSELHQVISDKESEIDKIELLVDNILSLIFTFLFTTIFSLIILPAISPIAVISYSVAFSILYRVLSVQFSKPKTAYLSSFLYKHCKGYRKLKDSLEEDKEKYSEFHKKDLDINDAYWQKKDEIDNKRRELEKLSVAVESMERKIGRKLIRERAVMFGVPSEILNIMQNIDDILEPNQESLEEGKKPYTLTT